MRKATETAGRNSVVEHLSLFEAQHGRKKSLDVKGTIEHSVGVLRSGTNSRGLLRLGVGCWQQEPTLTGDKGVQAEMLVLLIGTYVTDNAFVCQEHGR